jgi:hypothetical protein
VEWNEPGAMAEYDAYHNGYYLEIYRLDESDGWRWEIRREDEWLDGEPLDYDILVSLDEAKQDAERAAI